MSNCDKAMEAGFEALDKCRSVPGMDEQIRKVMLALWASDLLMSMKLGDPPKAPMADPRWYGLPADSNT